MSRSSRVIASIVVATTFGCRAEEGQTERREPALSSASSVSEFVPAPTESAPAPSASAPPAPPKVEYSVVWGPPGSETPASFLLEWRPPTLTVLGHRSGAIIFAAGGLYRWQKTKGKGYGLRDCSEVWEVDPEKKPDPNNRYPIETEGAMAKRLDAPGDVEIHRPDTFEDMSSFSNSVTLEASLGAWLFTSTFEDVNSCRGAHPFSSHGESVFDLEAKDFVAKYPTKDDEQLLRIEARQLEKAQTESCLQAARDAQAMREPADRVISIDALSLYTATPRWSKRRGLHFELYLGSMEVYVVGEKTCSLVVKHPPPSLERFPLPGAFTALPAKLPGFQPAGWAVIPADDAAGLEAAKRVFETRKKQTAPTP